MAPMSRPDCAPEPAVDPDPARADADERPAAAGQGQGAGQSTLIDRESFAARRVMSPALIAMLAELAGCGPNPGA